MDNMLKKTTSKQGNNRVVGKQVIDWLVHEIRAGEGIYLEDGRRIVGCSCPDLVKILGLNCSRKKVERAIKRLVEEELLERFQPNKAYRDRTYYYTFALDKYRKYVGCVEARGKSLKNENRVTENCPIVNDNLIKNISKITKQRSNFVSIKNNNKRNKNYWTIVNEIQNEKKKYLQKFLEKQKSKNEDDDKDKGSIGGEKSWNKYMQEKQKAGRKLKSVQEMMLIWNGTFKQELGLCKKVSIFLQAFLNKKCNKSIENWGKYLRKVKQQWDKSIYKGQQILLRIVLSFGFANRVLAGEIVFPKRNNTTKTSKAWTYATEFVVDFDEIKKRKSEYGNKRRFWTYCNLVRRIARHVRCVFKDWNCVPSEEELRRSVDAYIDQNIVDNSVSYNSYKGGYHGESK